MRSHYSLSKPNKKEFELWGLGILNDGDRYLTCGDDGTLRMWSSSQRKCTAILNLNIDENGMPLGPDPRTKQIKDCSRLTSIDVHPNNVMAVIGCEDGTVRIISIPDWKQVKLFRDRKKRISTVKCAPDGKLIAVGSDDAWIDFYISTTLKHIGKVKKHLHPITHIDWSKDSNYIQSTCKGYELLYFQAKDATHLPMGNTTLRDVEWATMTCVLGWAVQGIYGQGMDGIDINAVDRSHTLFEDYKVLACSEDSGKILLYRYPCLKKDAYRIEEQGHSSRVTNVKFSKNGNHLYSTGGEDLCVLQWKVTSNK